MPMAAIVGRPNVGKSTLFNRFVGRRKAIILDTPGLTRDRNIDEAEWNGRRFHIVDTGGYDTTANDDIRVAIREQTRVAIEEADVILFMLDVKDGMTALDEEIADLLRRSGKPVLLAVNKCDGPNDFNAAFSFAGLGFEPLLPICARSGHGVGDLLDILVEMLPFDAEAFANEDPDEGESGEDEEGEAENEPDSPPRIAIIGRTNVGKSTLVNAILGETRVIASAEAGTTRDSIDAAVTVRGKPYVIIDTAGIRRRGKIQMGAEKLSVMRADVSMRRADVAIVLIDASEGLTDQDAHVAGQAQEAGCAAIIAVNKWDLVQKDNSTTGAWAKALRAELKFLSYAPILFLSAKTGQRVGRIFEMVDRIVHEYRKRIPTGELNRWLREAVAHRPPPLRRGRPLRINYATQVAVAPPTFALFCNDPTAIHFSYQRYLINQLRERFGFDGTPVRLLMRGKWGKKDGEDEAKGDSPAGEKPAAKAAGKASSKPAAKRPAASAARRSAKGGAPAAKRKPGEAKKR